MSSYRGILIEKGTLEDADIRGGDFQFHRNFGDLIYSERHVERSHNSLVFSGQKTSNVTGTFNLVTLKFFTAVRIRMDIQIMKSNAGFTTDHIENVSVKMGTTRTYNAGNGRAEVAISLAPTIVSREFDNSAFLSFTTASATIGSETRQHMVIQDSNSSSGDRYSIRCSGICTDGSQVAISTISLASPAVVTTSAAHQLYDGQTVHMTGGLPGVRRIKRLNDTTFNVYKHLMGSTELVNTDASSSGGVLYMSKADTPDVVF